MFPGEDSIPVISQVKFRKQYTLYNLIGREHINPIIDIRVYELEYPDGSVDEYAVKFIIENIIDQVDDPGWDTNILEGIVDFCRDTDVATPKGDQAYTNVNGIQLPVSTTKGWYVQFKWIYQSTYWVTLHLIKESNPIDMAEHAMSNSY